MRKLHIAALCLAAGVGIALLSTAADANGRRSIKDDIPPPFSWTGFILVPMRVADGLTQIGTTPSWQPLMNQSTRARAASLGALKLATKSNGVLGLLVSSSLIQLLILKIP